MLEKMHCLLYFKHLTLCLTMNEVIQVYFLWVLSLKGSGKVGSFSINYGCLPFTLEPKNFNEVLVFN